MDRVGNLIKAQQLLLKKYKELKNKSTIESDEDTSDYYRGKYNTISGENLQLKELIAQYELQIFNFKKAIKEKDREIEKLKRIAQV